MTDAPKPTVTKYKVSPQDYLRLWQLRGEKAFVLDRSITRGDEWVQLDRVTGSSGVYYGHLGSKQFEVGGFHSPPLHTTVSTTAASAVDDALLENPLDEWSVRQRLLDFIDGEVKHDDVTLYNLTYDSHTPPPLARLLSDIAEEVGKGSVDTDSWVKVRAIQHMLQLVVALAEGSFQDAVGEYEQLSPLMERLALLVRGPKAQR